jgi:hypothetical protein
MNNMPHCPFHVPLPTHVPIPTSEAPNMQLSPSSASPSLGATVGGVVGGVVLVIVVGAAGLFIVVRRRKSAPPPTTTTTTVDVVHEYADAMTLMAANAKTTAVKDYGRTSLHEYSPGDVLGAPRPALDEYELLRTNTTPMHYLAPPVGAEAEDYDKLVNHEGLQALNAQMRAVMTAPTSITTTTSEYAYGVPTTTLQTAAMSEYADGIGDVPVIDYAAAMLPEIRVEPMR